MSFPAPYGTGIREAPGHGQETPGSPILAIGLLPKVPSLADEKWCEGSCVPRRECVGCYHPIYPGGPHDSD